MTLSAVFNFRHNCPENKLKLGLKYLFFGIALLCVYTSMCAGAGVWSRVVNVVIMLCVPTSGKGGHMDAQSRVYTSQAQLLQQSPLRVLVSA